MSIKTGVGNIFFEISRAKFRGLNDLAPNFTAKYSRQFKKPAKTRPNHVRSLTSQQIFPGQERPDTYQSEARLAEVKQNLTALAVVWPDAAVGREDSIGAESSHSNKVVIRRLSYLDLLLIGRFLLLIPQGGNPRSRGHPARITYQN